MKKHIRKILFIVCILVVIVCAVSLLRDKKKLNENQKVYQEVQKQTEKMKAVQESQALEKKEEIPIDFAELQKQNPDIYAWITIPGTNVNYPVLQSSTDNAYYLNHTIDGTEGYPGSIYTEAYNAKDFSDFNTVIYGHDMNDGTMFKDLHLYEDAEFLSAHPEVIVYTPERKLVYEIFAAVTYDDRHIMQNFNYMFESERQAFIDSVYGVRNMGSVIRDDVGVNTDSRILTLSTCIATQPDKRFLVEAVLKDE